MDASTSCAICTHPKMEAPRPTPLVFIKIPFGKRKHQLPFLCITRRRNNSDANVKARESFWHAERTEWCLQQRGETAALAVGRHVWFITGSCEDKKYTSTAKLIRLYLVSGTFLYVTMEEPLGEAGRGGVCLFLAARLLSNTVAADACAHEAEEEEESQLHASLHPHLSPLPLLMHETFRY